MIAMYKYSMRKVASKYRESMGGSGPEGGGEEVAGVRRRGRSPEAGSRRIS